MQPVVSVAAMLLVLVVPATAIDVFVSPSGDDSHAGTS
jgi:hypothetical protein